MNHYSQLLHDPVVRQSTIPELIKDIYKLSFQEAMVVETMAMQVYKDLGHTTRGEYLSIVSEVAATAATAKRLNYTNGKVEGVPPPPPMIYQGWEWYALILLANSRRFSSVGIDRFGLGSKLGPEEEAKHWLLSRLVLNYKLENNSLDHCQSYPEAEALAKELVEINKLKTMSLEEFKAQLPWYPEWDDEDPYQLQIKPFKPKKRRIEPDMGLAIAGASVLGMIFLGCISTFGWVGAISLLLIIPFMKWLD